MEYFQKMKQRVFEYWQSKDRANKIKIAISAMVIVLFLGVMLVLVSKPKYVPLYSNLDLKDAGDIAKKLEDNGIGYKLEDGGKTIMIDPEQKYKTRLMLAQEGLPKGGNMDFDDVFNKTRLGTTDWERQLQYNQALQGELTKSIENMEAVESARIYIVPQAETLFVEPDSSHEPSAAVFLVIKPGFEISKEEVTGVINLVSYAVKNMSPENITVVDQYGRTLSNYAFSLEENDQELINNQLVTQNNFQNQLQGSVQSLLEQIFGPGNIVVRVNAQLNFDKKTVEKRLFIPLNEETGEGIVRSIQELKEHFKGTGNVPEGAPGVENNVAGYQQLQSTDSEQQRTEIIKNFDISETHENLAVAPGAVDKLTVSVVVNRNLTDEEKDSIRLIVGNAIGYNSERDQVTIEGMEFKDDMHRLIEEDMLRQQKAKERMRNISIGGILLTILVALFFARTIASRRKRALEEEKLSEDMIAIQQAAAAQAKDEDIDIIDKGIHEKIIKHARRKPEDVAKVLKTWLSED